MQHIEITITTPDVNLQETLIAELSEIGFNGFEESESELKAYVSESDFDEKQLDEILVQHNLVYSKSTIKEQNWNEVWESNFQPLEVADLTTGKPWIGVRADFHQPFQDVDYEIVITPKMSFGTGHHATTYTVMQLMKEIDFKNKSVYDFGTGTGILAILAEMLGATNIVAVDNDDWCIENSKENIERNNCKHIEIEKVTTAETGRKFDILIANINKNIILDNLSYLAENVSVMSPILLSGLLKEDEADILEATRKLGWKHNKTIQKGMWIAMSFIG
ncbi:50S ribosomal protein L11 methyltransferase [Chitinophagaceae bacterium LWZ2-11]